MPNKSYLLRRKRPARGFKLFVIGIIGFVGVVGSILLILYGVVQRDAQLKDAYGIPIHQGLLRDDSTGRPGYRRIIRYIVIHETANRNFGADAKNHQRFLASGGSGKTSWHYTVDDHEIYHHIPDEEIAWHAGDLIKFFGGNTGGIGIELSVNNDGDFERTLDNGARLTARLLHAYGLELSAVKQHADFIAKNCPQTIRDNDRWREFLHRVAQYKSSV